MVIIVAYNLVIRVFGFFSWTIELGVKLQNGANTFRSNYHQKNAENDDMRDNVRWNLIFFVIFKEL